MNITERKAKIWLQSQGCENIIFQHRHSPDFLTGAGTGYEVKKLRQNTIVFSATQWEELKTHRDIFILIFNDKPEPEEIVPFRELIRPPSFWRQYRLVLVDLSIKRYQAQGRRLREAREKMGFTKDELAKKLGTSSLTIARWEMGLNKPSPLAQEELDRLARKVK